MLQKISLFWVTCLFVIVGIASAQDETEQLTLLLDEYVGDDEPGVVLLVSVGDETWISTAGLADLETGQAIAPDDLFRIGSITKPFVATLMLQLVDEGLIALDDPIADYLPSEIVSNVQNADGTTVRQMLQMTSGIYDYTESDAFDEASQADPQGWWTPEATVEYAFGEPAYFAPGDDYYYSNTNYNLAQIIIEFVTEQSLADVLEERIFAPLGMSTCYLETEATFAQNIVRGYGEFDGTLYDITDENDGVGLGDGGIICTAADLAKFPRALEDLISEDALNNMLATVEDNAGGMYGLGIGYDETDYGLMIGHAGATSGFQSNLAYLPEDDVVVVVLTNNFDSEIVEDLTFDAIDFVLFQ